MENPLELHRITLEIQTTTVPHNEIKFDMPKSTMIGSRFYIDESVDPDNKFRTRIQTLR